MYTFAEACRENTGAHFLDSGGAYGRHHEKPAIADTTPSITWDKSFMDCPATIETAHYLSEMYEIDQSLTEALRELGQGEEYADVPWVTCIEDFFSENGGLEYRQAARDNVYNSENDLSQVFIWEVWQPENNTAEWIYDDDALVIIQVHTGCDVRGGYAAPLVCRANGDYTCPVNVQAEYYITASNTMSDNAMRDIDERWSSGYSGYPMSEVEERVKRWFPWASGDDSRIALLDTGDVVKITASLPYFGQ